MGAMSDLYAQRMRTMEPSAEDDWVLRMARAMRLGHEWKARREQRVLEALRMTTDDTDGEAAFL